MYNVPRIKCLSSTNLDQDFWHSILMSVLRGSAALLVTAAHLRAQLFPGLQGMHDPTLWYQALAFVTGFAHQAVVVFFLLSGWLVGGSLMNKMRQPKILAAYAIDRITRMWIVLIPAFALSLAIGTLTGDVDPTRFGYASDNEYSLAAFAGNLFGLQDMAVPRFGGNFALWSLANEMWYYVLFPLLVVVFFWKSILSRLVAMVLGFAIAYHLSAAILLFFPVWLLGVVFSRIRIDATAAHRTILFIVLAAVAVYFRVTGSTNTLEPESFVQDCVFSIPVLLLLSSLQLKANRAHGLARVASRIGAAFAAFSFTLYVIHVPLLFLLRGI
jgi:peptidoglycan/LPS O-acetylase OafA/YrhL